MTYNVFGGTLNIAQLNSTHMQLCRSRFFDTIWAFHFITSEGITT